MMQIIECEQGSELWFAYRRGFPTASEFSTVLAKGKNGDESKTRKTYLLKLAGELITGESQEPYTNPHLERGKIMEEEARDAYVFQTGAELRRVGFIANNGAGCSPDALIGDNGTLEIKTALPHIHIAHLLKDDFPPEHKAQCQGVLWVAEREWIDLAIYWPKLPLIVKRAYRDDGYIANLAGAVNAFRDELWATVERVKAYGRKDAA